MKQENQNWEKEILESMRGSSRAVPDADLFDKIKRRIELESVDLIDSTMWRRAIAAAVLLLLVNTASLYYIRLQEEESKEESYVSSSKDLLLDSNYIY